MEVFITHTGARYHSRTDLDCMSKAQSFKSVDLLTAADGGLRPCLACGSPELPGVTEGDTQWLRRINDWQRSGEFDSLWEQVFARRVLARIPTVSADDVEIQSYINSGTDSFKVDFFIPKAKLVLEIDGYAKEGSQPSPSDHEKRNRRDAALQASGLTVLHFTNAQVQQEPKNCQKIVSEAITINSPKERAQEDKQPRIQNELETQPDRKLLYWIGAGAATLLAGLGLFALLSSSDSGNPAESTTVFANCAEARDAGVTPIKKGSPLYAANSKLDGDGDGVACE